MTLSKLSDPSEHQFSHSEMGAITLAYRFVRALTKMYLKRKKLGQSRGSICASLEEDFVSF